MSRVWAHLDHSARLRQLCRIISLPVTFGRNCPPEFCKVWPQNRPKNSPVPSKLPHLQYSVTEGVTACITVSSAYTAFKLKGSQAALGP